MMGTPRKPRTAAKPAGKLKTPAPGPGNSVAAPTRQFSAANQLNWASTYTASPTHQSGAASTPAA